MADELIARVADLQSLVKKLESETVVAIDTEFIREHTFFPQLELIQVATEKESWLIDYPAFRDPEKDFASFIDFLQSPECLKVFHAAQGDQECLYYGLGVTARPTIDTAIAGSLLGLGDQMGLAALLNGVLGIKIKKGHARTDWSKRPLSSQLLSYARADVEHLVKLGRALMKRLESKGRLDWAKDLTAFYEDHDLYSPSALKMASRISKSRKLSAARFGALVKLMEWREMRVRKINVPRRRVADDGTLIDLATVAPESKKHLSAFRGLNKREMRDSADAILKAIHTGLENPIDLAASSKQPKAPNSDENRAVTLLRCYLGLLSDEHELSSKYLVNPDQILGIIRAQPRASAELVEKGLLDANAEKLIGKELVNFLRGEKTLSLKDGKVEVR